MRNTFLVYVPGLLAGLVGGILGFYVEDYIRTFRFYAPVIPGALVGLLCGLGSVRHSKVRGALAGLIALASSVVIEWRLFAPPVPTDGSFVDFLAHFHQETPVTLGMLALGTFFGFWWGREATNPWRHRIG